MHHLTRLLVETASKISKFPKMSVKQRSSRAMETKLVKRKLVNNWFIASDHNRQ